MSVFVAPAPTVFVPRRAPSLYDLPASPSAWDDEFSSASLDPKWTVAADTGTFDNSSAIDAYAGFATGHRSSYNNYRKSWYMFQPAPTGMIFLQQAITFPTDCFIWARGSFGYRYSTQPNNDHSIGLLLGQLVSGTISTTNQVYCLLNESDANTVQSQGGGVTSGADTSSVSVDVGTQAADQCLTQHFEFFGIQKLGTTYHSFVATATGNWFHLRSFVFAGTVDNLAIRIGAVGTTNPGNMILGIDFVRIVTGKFLP